MAQSRTQQSPISNSDDDKRIGIQLDADTGRKLDELIKRTAKETEEKVGYEVTLSRTEMIRLLIIRATKQGITFN